MLPPNHQRLLDLLKSLDLNWPDGVTFRIDFNEDAQIGLTEDRIKTANLTIQQKHADPKYDSTELKLDDLAVGHA